MVVVLGDGQGCYTLWFLERDCTKNNELYTETIKKMLTMATNIFDKKSSNWKIGQVSYFKMDNLNDPRQLIKNMLTFALQSHICIQINMMADIKMKYISVTGSYTGFHEEDKTNMVTRDYFLGTDSTLK